MSQLEGVWDFRRSRANKETIKLIRLINITNEKRSIAYRVTLRFGKFCLPITGCKTRNLLPRAAAILIGSLRTDLCHSSTNHESLDCRLANKKCLDPFQKRGGFEYSTFLEVQILQNIEEILFCGLEVNEEEIALYGE